MPDADSPDPEHAAPFKRTWRIRGNNFRLRGLPEAKEAEDLAEIFRGLKIWRRLWGPFLETCCGQKKQYVWIGCTALWVQDLQIQGVPGTWCVRLHYYDQKKAIVQRAWNRGTVRCAEAEIEILPDLSRATLQRRAILRPLLNTMRATGATYRWGYPFHVMVRRGEASFELHGIEELPPLFGFLEIAPL